MGRAYRNNYSLLSCTRFLVGRRVAVMHGVFEGRLLGIHCSAMTLRAVVFLGMDAGDSLPHVLCQTRSHLQTLICLLRMNRPTLSE